MRKTVYSILYILVVALASSPSAAFSQNAEKTGAAMAKDCVVTTYDQDALPQYVMSFLLYAWYPTVRSLYYGYPNAPESSLSMEEFEGRGYGTQAIPFLRENKSRFSFVQSDTSLTLLYQHDTILTWENCISCERLSTIDGRTHLISAYDRHHIGVDSVRSKAIHAYYDSVMPRLYLHCSDQYNYDIVVSRYEDMLPGLVHTVPVKVLYDYDINGGLAVHPLCQRKYKFEDNDYTRALSSFAKEVCARFDVPHVTFVADMMEKTSRTIKHRSDSAMEEKFSRMSLAASVELKVEMYFKLYYSFPTACYGSEDNDYQFRASYPEDDSLLNSNSQRIEYVNQGDSLLLVLFDGDSLTSIRPPCNCDDGANAEPSVALQAYDADRITIGKELTVHGHTIWDGVAYEINNEVLPSVEREMKRRGYEYLCFTGNPEPRYLLCSYSSESGTLSVIGACKIHAHLLDDAYRASLEKALKKYCHANGIAELLTPIHVLLPPQRH